MPDYSRARARYQERRDAKSARKTRRQPGGRPHQELSSIRGTRIADLALVDDQVAVSITCWRQPKHLVEKAARTILDGDHKNVLVVLTSDGERRPSWAALGPKILNDPRVITVRSDANHGPYFHHDAIMRGSGASLFAVQDADDYSHKKRLDVQVRSLLAGQCDACFTPTTDILQDGRRIRSGVASEAGPRLSHRAPHFAVWSVPALEALGGYHAGFRVGFDSVLTSTAILLGRVANTKQPLYVRVKRAGSLTTAAATGHGSKMRTAAKAQLTAFYNEVYRAAEKSRRLGIQRHFALSQSRIRPERAAHRALVGKIRKAVEARGKVAIPKASPALLGAVIAAAPGSTWSVSNELARALYRHCEKTRPKRILDVGSGKSTLALALYAARHGATVVSLEHDPKWRKATLAALRGAGLEKFVRVVQSPVALQPSPDGRSEYGWYKADLERFFKNKPVDLIFVDGPPEAMGHGRGGVMIRCRNLVRVGTTVWMHDAARRNEQGTVRRWEQRLGMRGERRDKLDPRGVWVGTVTEAPAR